MLDCDTSDRIWREEVFGPVVCIRPFDDEEQMLREVNDSPYGLSGSLWTRDLDRAFDPADLAAALGIGRRETIRRLHALIQKTGRLRWVGERCARLGPTE